MDIGKRSILEGHLAQAERHVARGEQLLNLHRASIEVLRRDGHDVVLETHWLGEMEESQRLSVADRDRLSQELGDGLNANRIRRRLQRQKRRRAEEVPFQPTPAGKERAAPYEGESPSPMVG